MGPEVTVLANGHRVREVAVDLGPGRSPGTIAWSTHNSTLGAFWASQQWVHSNAATDDDAGASASFASEQSAEKVLHSSPVPSSGDPLPLPHPAPALVWLSNPGLGHPAVMEAWAPDLANLLIHRPRASTLASAEAGDGASAASSLRWSSPRCPVLVTSHSAVDQARDWNAVTEVLASAGVDTSAGYRDRAGATDPMVHGDSNYTSSIGDESASSDQAAESTPPTPQPLHAPWLAMAPEGPAPFRSRRAVADAIEGGAVAANWGAFAVGAAEAPPKVR